MLPAHAGQLPPSRAPIELQVFLTARHAAGIRLDAQGLGSGNGTEVPIRVIGPERAEFHHQRAATSVLHEMVKHQLLLGLVVTSKGADDLDRPLAFVAAGSDEGAFVHDLHVDPFPVDDPARIGHLGNHVGVAAAHGHRHSPLQLRGQHAIASDHSPFYGLKKPPHAAA